MSQNRIRIPCKDADIILAADKITSMILQPLTADGGIKFNKVLDKLDTVKYNKLYLIGWRRK
jgi:hypothetical protein